MGIQFNLSARDLRELKEDASLEDIIEGQNTLIRYINFYNKALGLSTSFNGYIAENVVFAATGAASGNDVQKIEHFLGFTPKYRIILKQTGNGVLEDIPSGWNDKYITLKNRGSEVVTATIWLVRE